MPPVTPRTIRRPASMAVSVGVGRSAAASAAAAASASAISSVDGPSTATILSAEISSKAIESGLRATELTCGGTIVPSPSPSCPKYELIWRARRAPSVTRRNFDSAWSRRPSIGGFIIVSCCQAMGLQMRGDGESTSPAKLARSGAMAPRIANFGVAGVRR